MWTNVRLACYNLLKVKSVYTKLKDKLNKEERCGVVYKIPCECNLCYVGQTKQFLESRIKQHRNNCKNVNILNENKTALASHNFEHHHNFDINNVEILGYEGNWLKRNISEMIFIKVNETVNKRTDTNGLSILYKDILKEYKSRIK